MWFKVALLTLSTTLVLGLECDMHKVDNCAGNLFFFAEKSSLGETAADIKADCEAEVQAEKCVTEYTEKCVNGLANGMAKLLTEGAKSESNQRCDEKHARRQDYNKHIACLNTIGPQLNRCMKDLAGAFEAAQQLDKKKQVPSGCCYMFKYKACLQNAAKAKCGQETEKYIESVVQGIAGDVLDTICSQYKDGSPKCTSLPQITPLVSPKYKTFLPSLITVLTQSRR